MTNQSKKVKLIRSEELLTKRYGPLGSESRTKFEEEAITFYYGEILKARRKQLKLTQAELAAKVGKKRTYISRIEKGEDLRLSNFLLLVNALGLSFDLKPLF